MYSPPVLPLVESPVLRTINPLTPLEPALPVRSSKEPPDVADPEAPLPLIIDTRPPDFEEKEVVPAMITISPPVPLLPCPTVTYTDPPRPLDAAPVPIYNAPVFPEPEIPVLKINIPLIPVLPAVLVLNTKSPVLLLSMLLPVKIEIRPPLVALDPEIEPDLSTNSLPRPLFPLPTVTYT